ncbi:MAG: imidazole glycerol phosphate synthase subunit HisF [Rhodospirillales bacterium]|jgi:imidazole glycerol-phosphate synthase subunit HisF|nr:imidazole glycerol phosphate synthase subunit HisF [Rhodospirillales bacterium]
MAKIRIIARLDVKGTNLIKGVHLEGLRVVGNPNQHAIQYYQEGADEILYMDVVASLYGRNNLTEVVRKTAKDLFIPITVGGGIRTVEDATEILRSGADKVAVNTAATKRPELLSELSRRLGSQCIVLSIEAKKIRDGKWEAYTDNGRERTGLDVIEWAVRGSELGAGEILLTSIDKEGTNKNFDLQLIKAVTENVDIPVIASGGMGSTDHFVDAVNESDATAVAMADVIHFNKISLNEIRNAALDAGINVRKL